jgi:hypothetical protein
MPAGASSGRSGASIVGGIGWTGCCTSGAVGGVGATGAQIVGGVGGTGCCTAGAVGSVGATGARIVGGLGATIVGGNGAETFGDEIVDGNCDVVGGGSPQTPLRFQVQVQPEIPVSICIVEALLVVPPQVHVQTQVQLVRTPSVGSAASGTLGPGAESGAGSGVAAPSSVDTSGTVVATVPVSPLEEAVVE